MIRLYMDVHVPGPITEQLRLRSVNVITAQDDGARRLSDEDLLERATHLQCIVVTQDKDFLRIARDWQRSGRFFAGIFFADQKFDVGLLVENLELSAKASEVTDWENRVEYLPFPKTR